MKPALANLTAVFSYLLLTCVYAWRVIINFGAELAGHGGDAYQNLWNMWWFERAMETGSNPWYTNMLHQPGGTTLLFHTLSPLNSLLAIPLSWIFGQPAAYNIIFIFTFVASAFTMYLLVFELFGSRWGAFLAGVAFSFSHYHFAHAQGHLNLASMQWVPLFLLGLLRTWRYRRIKDGVLMGVALVLTTFTEMYYAIFSITIALMATLVKVAREPKKVFEGSIIKAVSAGAGIWLVTGGVLVGAMIYTWINTQFVKAHDPRWFSADLQGFFVPGWISAWSGFFEGTWSKWTGNTAENSWYLGYSLIFISSLSFFLRPKKTRPWAWLALMILGLVLSLGPVLHWGGKIHDGLVLPFRVFEIVMPFVKMSGVPGRWHFLALVAISVLSGAGLGSLLERFRSKRLFRLPLGPTIAVILLVMVSIELAPRFAETRSIHQPSFIAKLKDRPSDEVVFDLGDWNRVLLRQTGHQHPMIGGYISRCTQKADDFWLRSDFTQTLRGFHRLPKQALLAEAKRLHLRYLIVPHWLRPAPHPEDFGAKLLFNEDGLSVWQIPWPTAQGTL